MPKVSNVYQDKKSKKWYFVANLGFDEKGNRLRYWGRGYKTQKEAKVAYEKYMNDFSDSAVKINSTMSYKEFYFTYFEPDYQRSVSQRTFENRISSMRKHLSYFYNTKLKDINAPMLKKWQNSLSKKYSLSYVRLVYGTLQRSLDLAVKLGLINKNIAKQVENVKKQKKEVDFWTKEEFEKVINTFDVSDYYEHYTFVLIWFLFMTCVRLGEAQALCWSDIDFANKLLTINKTMWYKSKTEFYIKSPKTRAGNRTIALDDLTINYLVDWKELQSLYIKTDYVFSYDGTPTARTTPHHIIERHAKLAGVHKIKTHALRHSHASLLISLGENAIVIRDRLGHEDIETTLGTYGHLYPNVNREVANKLNNAISTNSNEKERQSHKVFSSNQFLQPFVTRQLSSNYKQK